MYTGWQGLFLINKSSNQVAMSYDALHISELNLKDTNVPNNEF